MRAPLEKIIKIAHDNGALVLVDGAQGVPHSKVDFRKLGADFLAFSGPQDAAGRQASAASREKRRRLRSWTISWWAARRLRRSAWTRRGFQESAEKVRGGHTELCGRDRAWARRATTFRKIGMDNVEGHERKMAKKLIEAIESSSRLSNLRLAGRGQAVRAGVLQPQRGAAPPGGAHVRLAFANSAALRCLSAPSREWSCSARPRGR